jgi:thiosulfate/3-mercaptopyruvate sulfurtransferase
VYKTLISTAEAAAHGDDPAFVFIDVRHDLAQADAWGQAQYRAGHLPRAVFAHLDRDLSAPKTGNNGRHPLPSAQASAALFGRLGIDSGKQVIVYDQNNGMVASRLWWMLRGLGHQAVAVLDGGFDKWLREGRATTTEAPSPLATTFAIRDTPPVASADTVLASLPARSLLIVDARAPERFRGEVEPLDPVAGHIPGAVNRPFAANLHADATFRSAADLRAAFDALLAGRPPAEVVLQCGSGVSACHHALAIAHAGIAGVRLYPGSWSEWVADPTRPVATGPA